MLVGSSWGVVSHVQGEASTTFNATPLTATVTLTGVAAGDLITAYIAGNSGFVTLPTMSDGTSAFTQGSAICAGPSGSLECGMFFYLLSANGGTVTYTCQFASTSSAVELTVDEWNTPSGFWFFDTASSSSAVFTNCPACTNVDTGAITTTGTNEVVLFSGKLFDRAATTSIPLINGSTPTTNSYAPVGTYDYYYYTILTSTFANGHGTKTYSAATNWVAALVAFKTGPRALVRHRSSIF